MALPGLSAGLALACPVGLKDLVSGVALEARKVGGRGWRRAEKEIKRRSGEHKS